jgi:hypothetical protein
MPLPTVSPEKIDEALVQFDRDERGLPKWKDWEENGNY